jgi:hypothetical protein
VRAQREPRVRREPHVRLVAPSAAGGYFRVVQTPETSVCDMSSLTFVAAQYSTVQYSTVQCSAAN